MDLTIDNQQPQVAPNGRPVIIHIVQQPADVATIAIAPAVLNQGVNGSWWARTCREVQQADINAARFIGERDLNALCRRLFYVSAALMCVALLVLFPVSASVSNKEIGERIGQVAIKTFLTGFFLPFGICFVPCLLDITVHSAFTGYAFARSVIRSVCCCGRDAQDQQAAIAL